MADTEQGEQTHDRSLVPAGESGFLGLVAGLRRRVAQNAVTAGEHALSRAQDAIRTGREMATELKDRVVKEIKARIETPGDLQEEYRAALKQGLLGSASEEIARTNRAYAEFAPLREFVSTVATGQRPVEAGGRRIGRKKRQQEVQGLVATIQSKVDSIIRDTEMSDLEHAVLDYYTVQVKYSLHHNLPRDIGGAVGSGLQARGAQIAKGSESVAEALVGLTVAEIGKFFREIGERPRAIRADGSKGVEHIHVNGDYKEETAALLEEVSKLLSKIKMNEGEKVALQSLIEQNPAEALARLFVARDTTLVNNTPHNVWQYARILFYRRKAEELKKQQSVQQPQIESPQPEE